MALTTWPGRDAASSPERRPIRTALTTGADGRFRFADLPAGNYGVNATSSRGTPARSPAIPLADRGQIEITLRLGPGGVELKGRVFDAGGGTVPGARLTFLISGLPPREGQPPRHLQTVSDETGAYEVRLAGGSYNVTVEATGYATTRESVVVARTLVRDFRLAPGARLSGRVKERGTDRPVPNADVTLRTAERFPSFFATRTTRSDDDGNFTLADLDHGNYQLIARRGPLAGQSSGVITLGLAQVVDGIEVEVAPAHKVSGQVVAAGTRQGIKDATAMLIPDGVGSQPQSARTGADGAFVHEGVLPGNYQLQVSSANHARINQSLDVKGDRLGVIIELPAGARIAGRVVDSAGNGIEDVGLAVSVEGPMTSVTSATSGADGTFEARGLSAGRFGLIAHKEGVGAARLDGQTLAPGENKKLTLVLGKGGYVSGRVLYGDGGPASDVHVAVVGSGLRAAGSPRQTLSDAEGRYRLGPVPPGTAIVSADRQGRMGWRQGADPPNQRTFSLADGEEKSGVDLVVERGGHIIAGVVIGTKGEPVGLAQVVAQPEREGPTMMPSRRDETTFTSHEGQFTFPDLAAGRYRLRAIHPESPEAEVAGVQTGVRNVRLVLPPDTGVSGVVADATGGPITDYTLTVLPGPPPGETAVAKRRRQSEGWMKPRQSVHDAQGAFTVRRLTGGTHELIAVAADGRIGSAVITAVAGQTLTGVRITVATGLRVTGRAIDLDSGAPLVGAQVRAAGPIVVDRSVTTDAHGAFSIDNAPAAAEVRVVVNPMAATHVPESKRVTVPTGATAVDAGVIKLMRGDWRALMSSPERAAIAVYADVDDAGPMVRSARGPAAAAGIRPGDRIHAIAGRDAKELGTGALNFLLGGKVGSTLTITVASPGAAPRQISFTQGERTPAAPPR